MAESPKTKRKVKNPETFRERALKAAESDEKQPRRRIVRGTAAKVAKPVLNPLGRLLRKIFYRQPFRFIARLLVPKYFRSSWQELRLVKWPTWAESRKLTVAVLIFAVIFGLTIAALDWVIDKIFRQLLV